MPQPLAQLADVALDDVLVDIVAEQSVDVVEDLSLGDPAVLVVDEISQDEALAWRQRQDFTLHLRIPAIREDAQLPHQRSFSADVNARPDGPDAREDLSNVDGLADHVVDTGGKQVQRLVQG